MADSDALPHRSQRDEPPREVTGWLMAFGMNVAHYYADGVSLCGRWLSTTRDTPAPASAERCAPCVEKAMHRG
jgi:hypothetical protein